MKLFTTILIISVLVACFAFSNRQSQQYGNLYQSRIHALVSAQQQLLNDIRQADFSQASTRDLLKKKIHSARLTLKNIDFWLRYFEPVAYNQVNGPLPVEWENEAFEKFEAPYRRDGAGLSLAELYLDEKDITKDSLAALIQTSLNAMNTFQADSITSQLKSDDHFFFANRLYLLNLAAIYTTGFECPDTSQVIPELRSMCQNVKDIYGAYDASFPSTPLPPAYLSLYDSLLDFVDHQPGDYSRFDHFSFLQRFVNPLFRLNQELIRSYKVSSANYNDYSLSNDCNSIFDKSLYQSQNSKGIFSLVDDTAILSQLKSVGKLLFYDPILSGNNQRSCASCHKPTEYFTDTSQATALRFDQAGHLPRNAPSLINSVFNHLLMLDGKHISLQAQARDVITNSTEMGSTEKELLKKVLSCKQYRDIFKKLLAYTPEEKEITLDHIVSAITYYDAGFSHFYAPFDEAMNRQAFLPQPALQGFNLFMSKAQCATCHYVPEFNGVKPPYISSEFEVLGVPGDTAYQKLSDDKGRYLVNPAPQTLNAFRTGSLRNIQYTQPYMHNGVFTTLDQVINLYDIGGGAGKKLLVPNQTLSSDSLKLSPLEKTQLIAFLQALNENIIFDTPPTYLPVSSIKELNDRKIGGVY